MSADFPFNTTTVSPVKCNEKPWDFWVCEIGHSSPRSDGETVEAEPAKDALQTRRLPEIHTYKVERSPYKRVGINRLKYDTMKLHGQFPQMDNLNAAVCYMCGAVVKCSAVYRHLLLYHSSNEPIKPPPPPAPTVKLKTAPNRSRVKKEMPPLAPPVGLAPLKMETSPIHTATAPQSKLVVPQPDIQYLEEPSTSSGVTGEVQVCVESGELPVVSIQESDDLPLGDNFTDDIFSIMNSEGIQSADDIANSVEWNSIIRDIGNMQDINFSQPLDNEPTQDIYPPVDTATLKTYTLTEADLSSLQFTANSEPVLSSVLDANVVNALPAAQPAPTVSQTPITPSKSRTKTTKHKFLNREYDPNKHCGVVTADNPKPCTRSLTCKAHALSLRRMVEGRIKPFDVLLAEHRAARESSHAAIEPGACNGIADHSIPLHVDTELPVVPLEEPMDVKTEHTETTSVSANPSDVWWYTSSPRPLALCSFNASHAGGVVTLGKRFASVRANIKSSLSRSQCKPSSGYYYGQSSLSLTKGVHLNANKSNKPEVRRLIMTSNSSSQSKSVNATTNASVSDFSDVWSDSRMTVNGHIPRQHKRPQQSAGIDLGFVFDPLLADDKC